MLCYVIMANLQLHALKKCTDEFITVPPENKARINGLIHNHMLYTHIPTDQIIYKLLNIPSLPPNTFPAQLYNFKCAPQRDKKQFVQIIKNSLLDINMDLFGSQVYNPEEANDIDLIIYDIKDYIYVVTVLQMFFKIKRTQELCDRVGYDSDETHIMWTSTIINDIIPSLSVRSVHVYISENTYIKIDFVNHTLCHNLIDFTECTLAQKYDGTLWLRHNSTHLPIQQALQNVRDKKLTPVQLPTSPIPTTREDIKQIIKIWVRTNHFANNGFEFLAPLLFGAFLSPTSILNSVPIYAHIINQFVPPSDITNIILGYIIYDPSCEYCTGSANSFVIDLHNFPNLISFSDGSSNHTICTACFRAVVTYWAWRIKGE